jgi:hypothetical protein
VHVRRAVRIVRVVVLGFQGDHVQLAVSHAALRHQGIGKLAHLRLSAL